MDWRGWEPTRTCPPRGSPPGGQQWGDPKSPPRGPPASFPLPPPSGRTPRSGGVDPRDREATGSDIGVCSAVLDFGVGCGRIARHWAGVTGRSSTAATTTRCSCGGARRTCRFFTPRRRLEPPLRYRGQAFDLVYAYSVFTHLTEPLQHSWMASSRAWSSRAAGSSSARTETRRDQMEPSVEERYDRGEFAIRFTAPRLEPLLRLPPRGLSSGDARAAARGTGPRARRRAGPRRPRHLDCSETGLAPDAARYALGCQLCAAAPGELGGATPSPLHELLSLVRRRQ